MTTSVKSALYQRSNGSTSFDSMQIQSEGLSSVQPRSIPSLSINAAVASSLKLKGSNSQFNSSDSCLSLLNKSLSLKESQSQPLDEIIKSEISKMPNSMVLSIKDKMLNTKADKPKLLFSDIDLLKCCRNAQNALPAVNYGLRNCGNTCFLNSTLQCLLATGTLVHYVMEYHNKPLICNYANSKKGSRFCAACALYRLAQDHGKPTNSFMNNSGGILPLAFTSNITSVCPNFRPYAQEDAHEYLLGLLSKMEDGVTVGLGKNQQSLMNTNAIRRIFGGMTRSEVVCTFCRRVSAREESWFNLCMEVTKSQSLFECLANYTKTEILQDSNAYRCEPCNQLRHARKSLRISRPPPILIIQLNRFSRLQKLDHFVEFPPSFNMRPHMTESNGPPVIYNLYATVNHEGFTCRSGHYVAFTKRRNQWFLHDDTTVTSTRLETVLKQSPYLLFYQLASPEQFMDLGSRVANGPETAKSAVVNGAATGDPLSTASSARVLIGPVKPPSLSPNFKSGGETPKAKASSSAMDLSTIPLPPGPKRPPVTLLQPRVLTKPTPLSKSNSLPFVRATASPTPKPSSLYSALSGEEDLARLSNPDVDTCIPSPSKSSAKEGSSVVKSLTPTNSTSSSTKNSLSSCTMGRLVKSLDEESAPSPTPPPRESQNNNNNNSSIVTNGVKHKSLSSCASSSHSSSSSESSVEWVERSSLKRLGADDAVELSSGIYLSTSPPKKSRRCDENGKSKKHRHRHHDKRKHSKHHRRHKHKKRRSSNC